MYSAVRCFGFIIVAIFSLMDICGQHIVLESSVLVVSLPITNFHSQSFVWIPLTLGDSPPWGLRSSQQEANGWKCFHQDLSAGGSSMGCVTYSRERVRGDGKESRAKASQGWVTQHLVPAGILHMGRQIWERVICQSECPWPGLLVHVSQHGGRFLQPMQALKPTNSPALMFCAAKEGDSICYAWTGNRVSWLQLAVLWKSIWFLIEW